MSNFKESYKNTSILKYGVKHPWMNKDIHNKGVVKNMNIKNKKYELIIKNYLDVQKHKLIKIDW